MSKISDASFTRVSYMHIYIKQLFLKQISFLKTVLDLKKDCDSTESFPILCTQFPLLLTSYISRVHLLQLMYQYYLLLLIKPVCYADCLSF